VRRRARTVLVARLVTEASEVTAVPLAWEVLAAKLE
jgi:hypothetical protein